MTQPKTVSKFTPGPWKPTQDVGGRWHVDADYKGPESDYVPIADVKQGANDAALIAQAPEMYELLEKVSKLGTPLLDEAVSFLRAEARRIKAGIDGE